MNHNFILLWFGSDRPDGCLRTNSFPRRFFGFPWSFGFCPLLWFQQSILFFIIIIFIYLFIARKKKRAAWIDESLRKTFDVEEYRLVLFIRNFDYVYNVSGLRIKMKNNSQKVFFLLFFFLFFFPFYSAQKPRRPRESAGSTSLDPSWYLVLYAIYLSQLIIRGDQGPRTALRCSLTTTRKMRSRNTLSPSEAPVPLSEPKAAIKMLFSISFCD